MHKSPKFPTSALPMMQQFNHKYKFNINYKHNYPGSSKAMGYPGRLGSNKISKIQLFVVGLYQQQFLMAQLWNPGVNEVQLMLLISKQKIPVTIQIFASHCWRIQHTFQIKETSLVKSNLISVSESLQKETKSHKTTTEYHKRRIFKTIWVLCEIIPDGIVCLQ